jgi:serine/threonine protein phosphatase PrpC
MRVAGDTHVGKVREANEDSMIVDHQRGLYVVLDGMGGANAGDIASQTARDAIASFVQQRRLTMEPRQRRSSSARRRCGTRHNRCASATAWARPASHA